MKTVFIMASLLVATVTFANTKAKTNRTPQSGALVIDVTGSFMSAAHDPANIELNGEGLKTHLMSRFSDGKGKPIPVKVTAECDSEDHCMLTIGK